MIGSLRSVVIDCPDPHSLATFYSQLIGQPIVSVEDDWVVVGSESDASAARLAFQLAPDLQPPRWPDASRPQQFHLDVEVDDVEAAEQQVLGLGATRLPGEGLDFRVYADPAGHPFCLVFNV
jgi:hypothetical protein